MEMHDFSRSAPHIKFVLPTAPINPVSSFAVATVVVVHMSLSYFFFLFCALIVTMMTTVGDAEWWHENDVMAWHYGFRGSGYGALWRFRGFKDHRWAENIVLSPYLSLPPLSLSPLLSLLSSLLLDHILHSLAFTHSLNNFSICLVTQIIDSEIAAGVPAEKIVVGGFSQGLFSYTTLFIKTYYCSCRKGNLKTLIFFLDM